MILLPGDFLRVEESYFFQPPDVDNYHSLISPFAGLKRLDEVLYQVMPKALIEVLYVYPGVLGKLVVPPFHPSLYCLIGISKDLRWSRIEPEDVPLHQQEQFRVFDKLHMEKKRNQKYSVWFSR